MKQLIESYNMITGMITDFIYQYVLPPVFRVILFGLQITLAWAFYQTIVNVSKDLF